MSTPPAVPLDVLAALPPAVVDLLRWQADHMQRLTDRVAQLEAQIAKNSSNSSKPPSTEHPHAKTQRPQPKTGRSPGGQTGHAFHQRPLLPQDQCQAVIPCVPDTCRRCGTPLAGADPQPLRHQVWELPEIRPVVTEYQQHRLVCSCGCTTCGSLPQGVPTGQAGPRLVAFCGLLMTCFRQSKRRAALFLSSILNQPASPGWLVSLQDRAALAVDPAYQELLAALPKQPTLHVDESPTKQGKAKAWIWTFVALTFTVFTVRLSRKADVPRDVLGAGYAGVIPCDRARMYWVFGRLQYCWVHLKRDIQGLIDGPGTIGRRLGQDLMRPVRQMFGLWQQVKEKKLTHAEFREQMKPLRQQVESLLLRGYFNAAVRGFCKDLWEHRERLWVFVDQEGVEPTNNAAEQALRQAVIWRKLSFGTQSASGSRFVERLLSVIETCRRQGRDVFGWMTQAVSAHFAGQAIPSLLPEA